MRRVRVLYFILILFCFSAVAGSADDNRNILILHSYQHEYPWTKEQHKGFIEALAEKDSDLHIATEFLNTKINLFDESYRQFFMNYLQQKYRGIDHDIVYVTDDNALLFVKEYRRELFPKAKIFFSGINDIETAQNLDHTIYTGVIEKKGLIPNIDLIKIFKPRVKQVIVVGDASNTYQAIANELKKGVETRDDIELRFIASPLVETLIEELQPFENEFLLLTTIGHLKNSHAETLLPQNTIELIVKSGKHTIFTMEDSYMYPGVVGGYVTSGLLQGRSAGEMVVRYLQEGHFEAIAMLTESPNRYLFDRQELKKAKLYLPPEIEHDSLMLNEDVSFYMANRVLILNIIGTLIVISFASLLYTVIITRRKNRIIEERTYELEQKADALEEARSSLTQAQRIARLGSWEWDVDHNVMNISDEVYGILEIGQEHERLTYRDVTDFIHEEDRENVIGALDRLKENADTIDIYFRIVTAQENEKVLHLFGQGLKKENESERIVGTVQDVTEQRSAEKHLEYLANYDLLTDLPNRNLFMQHLLQAMNRAKRSGTSFALLFLDLDNFKIINDTLGHDKGDLLLVNVAKRLKEHMRESDLVVRMGGDEFVILVENVKRPVEMANMCEKIVELFSLPVNLEGNEVFVTTSIGISIYPDDGDDPQTLIKHADIAMYHSKEGGKNSFHFFTSEMNERALTRLVLENNLRRAIENHELELFYQPQVELGTNKIIGAEALLRWNLTDVGYIQPEDFIGVAEETNLIVPIGCWVLQKLMEEMASWKKEGIELVNMAFNVSSRQFLKNDLQSTIQRFSEEYGIVAELLTVEITEGILMETSANTLEQLINLRALGVKISIDDFGTGYSSLSYLKKLPIDKLKIDRSFIMDLEDDKDDQVLTRTIISMAKSLNLEVVAEGVETHRQKEFLQSEGCRFAQGYYYSRPIPSEDFTQLLKSQRLVPISEKDTGESSI